MLAKRGRKPKLKVIDGSRNPKAHLTDPARLLGIPFGEIDPPVELYKRKKELWDQCIRPCSWLCHLDAHMCLMWVRFAERHENAMLSKGEIAFFKSLSASLGREPNGRFRLAAGLLPNEEHDVKQRIAKLMGRRKD